MKAESVTWPCGCTCKATSGTQVMWEMAWCPLHKAAPDLLAACKRVRLLIRQLKSKDSYRTRVLRDVETAIAKAEGTT